MQLRHIGQTKAEFGAAPTAWVRMVYFRFPNPAGNADSDVLTSMLSHPAFRNESQGLPGANAHGPYPIEALSPKSYQQVDSSRAGLDFGRFLDESFTEPKGIASDLRQIVGARIGGARMAYRLSPLSRSSNEQSFVYSGFSELVLIDSRGLVNVVMTGVDTSSVVDSGGGRCDRRSAGRG